MHDSNTPTSPPAAQPQGCTRCGAEGASPVGDEHLCPECFQLAGACCAGCDDPDASDCHTPHVTA